MNVRRALIVGLGAASAATVQQLKYRFDHLHGGIPVVDAICILSTPGPDNSSVLPLMPDLGIDQADITTLMLPPGDQAAVLQDDQFVASVCGAVRTAINSIRMGVHITNLNARGIEVLSKTPLEMILVGDLAEEFVALHLIGLAKHMYNEVVQQETNLSVASAAILVVPEGGAYSPAIKARAYSSLQALDQYLAEQKQLGLRLKTERLALQEIYLLEPNNSANQRLRTNNTLFPMVGDWLYHYLTGDLAAAFQTRSGAGSFRSLGCASLFVPADELIEAVASQFANEVFSYLLFPTNITHKEAEKLWEAVDLGDSKLTADLNHDLSLPQLHASAFSNTTFPLYKALEMRLSTNYDNLLTQNMPKAEQLQTKRRQEMAHMARQAMMTMEKTQLLQQSGKGAIRSVVKVFQELAKEFQDRQDEYRGIVQRIEQQISSYDQKIQQNRYRFWSYAETFGQPITWLGNMPFFWFPVVGVAVMLALVTYIAQVLWLFPTLRLAAGLLVCTSLIAIAASIFGTLRLINTSKQNVIIAYSERLKMIGLQQQARGLRMLYTNLLKIVNEEFLDRLSKMRESLNAFAPNEQTGRFPLQPGLYGTPRYELEVSVLDPSDLEAIYHDEQGFGSAIEDDIRAFFNNPTLWDRLQAPPALLRAELIAWARAERLHWLRERPALTYLNKYPEQRRKDILRKLIDDAHVYSRVNTTLLDHEHSQVTEWMQLKFPARAEDETKKLLQQATQVVHFSPSDDPLRIIAMSVLSDLSLAAFMVVTNELQLSTREAAQVVSSSISVKLADDITQSTFSVDSLIALAHALEVLKFEEGMFGYLHEDEEKQFLQLPITLTFMPLENSLSGVVSVLREPANEHHIANLYHQVVASLQKAFDADGTGQQLGRSLDTHAQKAETEDWAQYELKQYIKRLVQRYRNQQASAVP